MHLDIGNVTGRRSMDIVMEILRMRDKYIIKNGHPPKTITMTKDTFSTLIPRLDTCNFVCRTWDDFSCTFKFRIADMDVEFVK